MTNHSVNPYRYGTLALDEAFTDREAELAELTADTVSGQDVVIIAPRRYGKSSLIWRLSQELVARGLLVAQVDLTTTPTKEKLTGRLAKAIHEQIASAPQRATERLRVLRGLRLQPSVTVDPDDGSLAFTFTPGRQPEDIDATLERLLELPAQLASERGRSVVLVFDEFQEIVEIDPQLPRLMRAVFQRQPEVSHVYLGSKREMMRRIFNDENAPFWRSAKPVELGVIAPEDFRGFIAERFTAGDRRIEPETIDALLAITGGHPYATQELCYFLWSQTGAGARADGDRLAEALSELLASEDAHFTLLWDRTTSTQRVLLQALAREPGRPFTQAYRQRHGLPDSSRTQRALSSLAREEIVDYQRGEARIGEPFLAEWIRRAED